MTAQTIRRARRGLVGLPSTPFTLSAAQLAAAAALLHPAEAVEQAWASWRADMTDLNDGGTMTNEERDDPNSAIWKRIKAADDTIRTSEETGARVAEIRLWMALTYEIIHCAEVDAIHREDIDWLVANVTEPEYSTMMAMAAIKALRGENA